MGGNDTSGKAPYQAMYYKDGNKIMVSSESKESLFRMVRASLPDANKNTLIYISKYNGNRQKYETEGRYRLLSGEDVTKIKLDMASMEKEQFDEVRKYIKELGAQFDGNNNSWYVLRSNENKDAIMAYLKAQNTMANQHKETYVAMSYLKDGKKPGDVRYGDSVEGILKELQESNKSKGESEKFMTTYVKQLNPESNQYDTFVGRFNTDSGQDITKIFLSLPYVEKEKFDERMAYLTKNGAKFDGKEKKWYITPENDINKFLQYLSINGKEQSAPDLEVGKENREEEEPSLLHTGELMQEAHDKLIDMADHKKRSAEKNTTKPNHSTSLIEKLHQKQDEVAGYNSRGEISKNSRDNVIP